MHHWATFIIVLSGIPWCMFGQNLPSFTQYREMAGFINPAAPSQDYFLYEYNLITSGSHRNQWVGSNDGPTAQFFKIEYVMDTHGTFTPLLGLNILKDEVGPSHKTAIYGRVGALLAADPYYGSFSIGFNLGYLNYTLTGTEIDFLDPADPLAGIGVLQSSIFDLGIGVYYYKRFRSGRFKDDDIYAGFSVPQLFRKEQVYNSSQSVSFTRLKESYIIIGAHKYLNESSFIEPSVWIKMSENVSLHVHMLTRYYHNNNVWGALGYTSSGVLHAEFGWILGAKKAKNQCVKLGYGFDIGVTQNQVPFGTSHEVNFSLSLDTKN